MNKHSTKVHRSVFRYICQNLDQDLDSPKCRAIRKHLTGCADCMTYLDSLKKTIALYKNSPVPPISPKAKAFLRLIPTAR